MYDTTGELSCLVGRTIISVRLDKTRKDRLTFELSDGGRETFITEADCCSRSWIEHLELPRDVAGATVTEITESEPSEIDDPAHECLQSYRTTVRTNRGDIDIEYRNSSNGYYGGWLERVRP